MLFQDGVGVFLGDLFDIHAPGGGSHEHGLALGAVHQDSKVKLFFDGKRFFDQQAAHHACLRGRSDA